MLTQASNGWYGNAEYKIKRDRVVYVYNNMYEICGILYVYNKWS